MKHILILLAAAALFSSCSNDDDSSESVTPVASQKTTITFDARAGSSDFALNKDFTIGTQVYNFTKLRYWVSNISLTDSKGVEYKVPNSYYLMEEVGDMDLTGTVNDNNMIYPANKRESITLNDIPAGDYKKITFSIGVDPKYNDNLSLQAGELSIASGMSSIAWMWHTSYIFSSIAGTVKQGTDTATFSSETGLNANFKTVSVEFTSSVDLSKPVILNVDVTKIFDGVDLVKNPKINAASATLMSAVAGNMATKAVTLGSATK
ncbi:MbnP family protein [Dyadobacter sp. 3J3]|uniref:MbnP family protein n=1 Tax=Dyadobacter sp. 3J3 TaxID=2606600 RepID=UPI00135BCACA|nr:MbnP family protein [Dyadobacter sp. 3J3]